MRGWRWGVVVVGLAALVALPTAFAVLPAAESDATAADLLARVQGSTDTPFTGYAEAEGGLLLPVTRDFTDLVDLFGERTRLRAFWASAQDWRVDELSATGERGVYHRSGSTLVWDYEDDTATLAADPAVRLPRAADLLPSALGQRLLSEALPSEVTRLPARRLAGVDAPGLRLVPADPRTTIDRVDVWLEPLTGLPVQVEVYGGGATRPAVRARFLDLDLAPPAAGTTGFSTPEGARLEFADVIDVASAADRFGPVYTPDGLAGFGRRPSDLPLGALGQYGRGVTVLSAAPVWDRLSRPLRDQLAATPGAVVTADGVYVAAGPIGVLLTPGNRDRASWIIAGTVDRATLTAAAAEVRFLPVPDQ